MVATVTVSGIYPRSLYSLRYTAILKQIECLLFEEHVVVYFKDHILSTPAGLCSSIKPYGLSGQFADQVCQHLDRGSRNRALGLGTLWDFLRKARHVPKPY